MRRVSRERLVRVGLALICLAAAAGSSSGSAPEQVVKLFEQGNRLYRAEDYSGARQAYREILDAGYEAPEVYYNLGNAALKSDDLGRAVWAYARAERLDPRNPDVASNLSYARALTVDAEPAQSQSWFLSNLAAVSARFTTADAVALATILFWVGCGLLVVILLAPTRRRAFAPLLWVVGVVLAATLVFASMRGVVVGSRDTAVILPTELDVQSSPGEDGQTVFSLHAGTEVRLDRVLGGWVEISLGPDLKGWVPEDLIAVI